MADSTSSQEKQLRDIFKLFDKDRSGHLSKKELKNVLKALQIKIEDKDLEVLLNQMDLNGSGGIEFDEFKAALAKRYFRRHSKEEIQAAFKRFDYDNNGYLSIDEVQSVMSNMGRQMSRNEIKSMIQTLDIDHDGKISLDEFVKLFD